MEKIFQTLFFIVVTFSSGAQSLVNKPQTKKKTPIVPILQLSKIDYEQKVHAIWAGQIIATLMGLPAEHNVASVKWIDKIPGKITTAPVDDDWYYEMIAIKGFEKYGTDMTVAQLGEMWKQNNCGSWGSSHAALINLSKGIQAPLSGNPLYNRFWFTIGPQFSSDVYGALAPGMPNVAGKLAREYGHVNGYAEGVDGAVFVAGMISLGFVEKDPKKIVRMAAQLIDAQSPYRQCINMLIELADKGKSAAEVLKAVEDKWHIEYPATNNAVANGGIVATCLWFGEADFLKTVNLAARSLDYTDSDCNAANAIGVIMAMKGLAGIPAGLLEQLGDRIKGDKLGPITFNPPIDESISKLAERTAKIGMQMIKNNGGEIIGEKLSIPLQTIAAQPAELFKLSDYAKKWNADWQLEGAGFSGFKGATYLEMDSNILVTYPRDETRRLYLHQTIKINGQKQLSLKVGAEKGKDWELIIYIDDKKVLSKVVENLIGGEKWQDVAVDLMPYQNQEVKIRLFQNVLVDKSAMPAGNAFWKKITVE